MSKTGWIIVFAHDESGPIAGFLADDEWITPDDPNAPGAFDEASFYPDSCNTIQEMRSLKGNLQRNSDDRDVRLAKVEKSIRFI